MIEFCTEVTRVVKSLSMMYVTQTALTTKMLITEVRKTKGKKISIKV